MSRDPDQLAAAAALDGSPAAHSYTPGQLVWVRVGKNDHHAHVVEVGTPKCKVKWCSTLDIEEVDVETMSPGLTPRKRRQTGTIDATATAPPDHFVTSSSDEGDEAIITGDDGADCAANIIKPITPHPPAKRVSRRLEAARRDKEEKSKRTKKAKNMEDVACEDGEGGTSPQCGKSKADEGDRNHTNGYFEVDDILDRRTRKYGSESAGLRHVVEYLVSWKVPADYDGDASSYGPSWQIAENLDQNSLASAFRKFPVDGDPDRESVRRMQQIEMDTKGVAVDECLDLGDFFSDDEEKEMEEESEDEDDETTDIMQEYDVDVEEQSDKSAKVVKDPDVSCLEESGELYHMQANYCKYLSGYMLILLYSFPQTTKLLEQQSSSSAERRTASVSPFSVVRTRNSYTQSP